MLQGQLNLFFCDVMASSLSIEGILQKFPEGMRIDIQEKYSGAPLSTRFWIESGTMEVIKGKKAA